MADNLNAVPYVGYSYGQPSTAVRNGISDTNYTATSTDTLIAYVTLTAARTVTLPAASSVPAGKQFIIKDESGNCSSGNTITIVGIIDGVSNLVLNTAYSNTRIYSNGTNWSKVGA